MELSSLVALVEKKFHIVPELVYGNAFVSRLCSDSREIQHGDLFVCMPSQNTKTHDFLPDAKTKGAVAAIVHNLEGLNQAKSLGLAALLVLPKEYRFIEYLGFLAREHYSQNFCFDQIEVIGITGTNGKTTSAWLLYQLLNRLGRPTSYIGTLGFYTPASHQSLNHTSPFPIELWSLISKSVQENSKTVVVEVSSQALVEKRFSGLKFHAGVYTNISQDHLDFHRTMEEYQAAKRSFFDSLGPALNSAFKRIICIDDVFGQKLLKEYQSESQENQSFCENRIETSRDRVYSFSLSEESLGAHLLGKILHADLSKIELGVCCQGKIQNVNLNLGGLFNAQNALSAIAGAQSLGYSLNQIASEAPFLKAAPGRLEPIKNGLGIYIFVDYAHAPGALEKLLHSVKKLAAGRVITVFGCGGDRDRTKRPLMAKIAGEYSDFSILTSDNPRTEDPEQILKDAEKGFDLGAQYVSIVDRRSAIEYAVMNAKKDDVVLITGKGHENYQIIGQEKVWMDDCVLALKAVETREESLKAEKLRQDR